MRRRPAAGTSPARCPQPRLRKVDCTGPGLRRVRRGRGFSILDPDGERVDDPEVLTRVNELVIPPAWEDVWICPYPGGHIQATGVDQRGRKQYLYHPRWRARRDADQVRRHGRLRPHAAGAARARRGGPRARRLLPRPRPGARRPAAGPRLLPDRLRGLRGDQRDLRVGHDEEAPRARPRRRSCTSTTRPSTASGACRRSSTASVAGDICRLKKRRGGGDELLAYKDPATRRWVDVKSADINAWLKDATGEDVSAKDFRTWGATVLASVGLAVSPVPTPRRPASARSRASSRRSPTTSATRRRSRARPTSTRATFERYLDGITIAGRAARPGRGRATAPRSRATSRPRCWSW